MNRKQHPALAMAVAAVTGLGLTAFTVTAQDQSGTLQERQDRTQQQERIQDRAQDHRAQGQQVQKPTLPQGIEESGEADLDAVRGVLREVANAAFTDDGFDDLVERFVDQDRNRFGEWMDDNDDFDQFNTAVENFRSAYEEKYGQALDIDAAIAFEQIQAAQGEVKNPEQVAGNWPVKASEGSSSSMDDRARLAGARQGGQEGGQSDELEDQEDSNIEEGRQVAVVAIPGPEGKPAINASLVNEFPGTWKIDIPNDQKGQDTYQKLTQRIEKLTQSTDQWPEDAQKAQQLLAYEVLAAVYGVDAEKSGQQSDTPNRLDREDGMPERDRDAQRQQGRSQDR